MILRGDLAWKPRFSSASSIWCGIRKRLDGVGLSVEIIRGLSLAFEMRRKGIRPKTSHPAVQCARNQEPRTLADLEFPINPDFDSRPPRLDPQVMLRRIAKTMPWRSTRPGAIEHRLAEKVEQEFFL